MGVVGVDRGTHVELVEDDSTLCATCGHCHWHYASTDGKIHCRVIGCKCNSDTYVPHPDRRFKRRFE